MAIPAKYTNLYSSKWCENKYSVHPVKQATGRKSGDGFCTSQNGAFVRHKMAPSKATTWSETQWKGAVKERVTFDRTPWIPVGGSRGAEGGCNIGHPGDAAEDYEMFGYSGSKNFEVRPYRKHGSNWSAEYNNATDQGYYDGCVKPFRRVSFWDFEPAGVSSAYAGKSQGMIGRIYKTDYVNAPDFSEEELHKNLLDWVAKPTQKPRRTDRYFPKDSEMRTSEALCEAFENPRIEQCHIKVPWARSIDMPKRKSSEVARMEAFTHVKKEQARRSNMAAASLVKCHPNGRNKNGKQAMEIAKRAAKKTDKIQAYDF